MGKNQNRKKRKGRQVDRKKRGKMVPTVKSTSMKASKNEVALKGIPTPYQHHCFCLNSANECNKRQGEKANAIYFYFSPADFKKIFYKEDKYNLKIVLYSELKGMKRVYTLKMKHM
ncbi:hypothetical protein POVCU1_015460 [Plasmodium ovale curtisi]|uniref:Uncharacterized protein n=1 Tax=Plasmodium ovale curtisi TaxID=864141 RepID=A0A1A8W517_PLAOA|nr:hypothetical protein POVCU1_015460 [Plasmodium ovale curtisi]